MRTINFLIITTSALLLISCGGNSQPAPNADQAALENASQTLKASQTANNSAQNGTGKSDLDANEEAGLVLMREEEKLARDVYATLFDIHSISIFNNIASSEQTHTDAVKSLLTAYLIEDPVSSDAIGVFTNPDLQDLYHTLVSLGTPTTLDALYVGATIEELDIYDLNRLMDDVVGNADITVVYNNLLRGSRNHLRSFNSQIIALGGSYQPSYITQALYDEIAYSAMERGGK